MKGAFHKSHSGLWLPRPRPLFVHPNLRTAAQVNDLLGISPTHLWIFDETASPIVDRAAGTANLTLIGTTPNRGTPWAKRALGFTSGSGDASVAAGVANPALASFGFACVLRAVNVGYILSKNSAGAYYRLYLGATGVLQWQISDGIDVVNLVTGAQPLTYLPIVCGVDRDGENTSYVATPFTSLSASAAAVDSITNATSFRFGDLAGTLSAGMDLVWAAYFSGAAADRATLEAAVRILCRGLR